MKTVSRSLFACLLAISMAFGAFALAGCSGSSSASASSASASAASATASGTSSGSSDDQADCYGDDLPATKSDASKSSNS